MKKKGVSYYTNLQGYIYYFSRNCKKVFLQLQDQHFSRNYQPLVNRCNGDRGHLKSELDKILIYIQDKKNITLDEIYKLTNLVENFHISELVDNSLSKNIQKTSEIISESNYKSEDGILILRTFLQKAKRLLNLYEQDVNKNYENLINNYSPPIFWKEKPIVKKHLESWSKPKIETLISKINKLEIFLKKIDRLV